MPCKYNSNLMPRFSRRLCFSEMLGEDVLALLFHSHSLCPQGEGHPALSAGRNNGTRALQFQSTDSLLSCPENSPLVQITRSLLWVDQSAMTAPPPPCWKPKRLVSCSVIFNRMHILSLSLHLLYKPSYVCAVSMVTCGITMALVA